MDPARLTSVPVSGPLPSAPKAGLGAVERAFRSAGRLLALSLLAAAVASCSLLDYELPTPDDFPVKGIDVSYYQEEIDWGAVGRSGVAFAWIKSTEGGDWADPRFHENWYGAAAAGVPRGAYHFWYFCRPVEDQIAWFIQNVPVDPTSLPPVLDMEWNHQSPTCRRQPDRAEIHADMRAWLEAIEAHYGKRPVIYTSVDFHRDRLVGAFSDYHIWVRSVAGHPSIRYGDRRWHFWQHTAEGRVPGIRGNVDRNVFAGSVREWRNFLAGRHGPDS